jgi:hypothetical protein
VTLAVVAGRTTGVVSGRSLARRVRLTRTVGVVSVFFGTRGILLLELRSPGSVDAADTNVLGGVDSDVFVGPLT